VKKRFPVFSFRFSVFLPTEINNCASAKPQNGKYLPSLLQNSQKMRVHEAKGYVWES
jgi:hypothetical protein